MIVLSLMSEGASSHTSLQNFQTITLIPGMRILVCQQGVKFSTIGVFGWSGYIGNVKGSGRMESHAIRLMLVDFTGEIEQRQTCFLWVESMLIFSPTYKRTS